MGGTPFHSSYGPGPGNGGWNKPNLAKSKEELLATEVLMWRRRFSEIQGPLPMCGGNQTIQILMIILMEILSK